MPFTVANISFDCDDVLKVAHFWSEALGRPLDAGSSEVWASIGGTELERRQAAWYFAKVPESKRAKNRVHLDLVNPEPGAVEALVKRGATVISHTDWGYHAWTVMEDPEGNVFCVATKPYLGADEPITGAIT